MQRLFHIIRSELRGSWRYRWYAIVVAWGICMIGWTLVFSMPDIYEARARVFVDADSRLSEVMGEVGVSPGVGSRVYVVRQAMLARQQLERVASETGLSKRAKTAEEQEELMTSLQENIGVGSGRTKESQNLYTITFEDPDRTMAVAVVRKLLDTFVEDVLKLKVQDTEEVSGYLENQLSYYGRLLSEAEVALASFRKEFVGLLPGESGGIFQRLQTEMKSLDDLQRQLQTEEDRRTELRRQLQSEEPFLPEGAVAGTGVAVPGSSTEAAIKATESRRSELLLAFTDRHPDIVAINEQLRQLYQQRDTERSAMAGSATGIEGASNATNPVYQTVQIALNNTGVKVAELRSKVNQASATVRQLNKQIETIPEVETRYSELSRNYAQYASLYDELLLRKERERLGNVGEDQDVVSFNIIDPPAADIEPVAPRRALFLVAVLLLGLMGGGAAAFLMHLLNPVFQDARSLHNYTGRPVLGAVSMTWLDRHKVGRRIDVSTFALASTSLVALFIVSILFMDQFSGLMRGLLAPDLG